MLLSLLCIQHRERKESRIQVSRKDKFSPAHTLAHTLSHHTDVSDTLLGDGKWTVL